MITIIDNDIKKPTVENSPHSHRNIIAQGFRAIGIKPNMMHIDRGGKDKHVCCWGWRQGKRLHDRGFQVLVMERGYIGDRFKYTSLAWNGLNGHAEFPEIEYKGKERFYEHGGSIKPWKESGKYALILGQVLGDASLQGKDLIPWYYEKAMEIKAHYGIPVYFRPHPESVRRGGYYNVPDVPNISGQLEENLNDALFTVCFNSNSAVDSVLAGVPCVVGDRGTMAYEMCSTDIKNLIRPEREEWAYRLAYKQHSVEEITSGQALKEIIKRIL